MAIDRANVLRNAEKLLRQGRLDQAIAEYLRVVEDQPRDWNTANLLGDLYVRAGQLDRALQQFTGLADTFAADGFLPRAAAVYKKVLKLDPGHEYALRKAGDIAARQGLVADARNHYTALLDRRRQRRDEAGVAEAERLLQSLDPKPVDAIPAPVEVVEEPAPSVDDLADAPAVLADAPLIAVAPDVAEAPAFEAVAPVISEPLPIAELPVETDPPPLEVVATEPSDIAESFDAGVAPDVAPPEPEKPLIEVDLSAALDALLAPAPAAAAAPKAATPAAALDDIFAAMRDEAAAQSGEDQAQRLYQRALTLAERGAVDEAVQALKSASRSPRLRFAAASQLGRLYQTQGAWGDAVVWLEHAAEVPAPRPADGYDVLFDLAEVLEREGEPDRAMAVLLELKAEAGNYKDLDSSIGRLDRVRAGG